MSSCELNPDSFHGTKKGMRRKTVSSRRAYVSTPEDIRIQKKIMGNKQKQQAMTYLYQIIKRHDPELHSGQKEQQPVEVSYGRLIVLYNMILSI